MNARLPSGDRRALCGPFATELSANQLAPSPAVKALVRSQVDAILSASPAVHELSEAQREEMRANMEKIAAYSAALIQADWSLSERLGQQPLLVTRETIQAPIAQSASTPARTLADRPPAADEFSPRAADQVARITRQTLNAIEFPVFVAELIKGTYQAIVDAAIEQMEAYAKLLANVAKTVDQYMADNITENQARDHLAQTYPGHFKIETDGEAPRVTLREGSDSLSKPDFKSEFGLSEDVELSDDTVEEVLVPAARRRLAQNRHSMLAVMVMMGMNRIVVTSGSIKAKMGFRIDASDKGTAQSASQFDVKHEMSASAGFLAAKVKTSHSVAYVSSTKKDSSDELNVEADLTGEVELKFKSDYMPMQKFATENMIALIQGNTPNPKANVPVTGSADSGSRTPPAPAAAAPA